MFNITIMHYTIGKCEVSDLLKGVKGETGNQGQKGEPGPPGNDGK